MRAAVFEPRKDPSLGAVGAHHRLHGAEVHRERSGIGLLGVGFQGARKRVQRAPHLHRVDRRAPAFGRRETRTIVQAVEQSDRREHRKHGEGRHGRPALRHPPPRRPQVLLTAHVQHGGDDAADQDENQRVGPEHDGDEGHHCSRMRGSTRVYEISVSSNPRIVSTEPMKTMARTTAKSCGPDGVDGIRAEAGNTEEGLGEQAAHEQQRNDGDHAGENRDHRVSEHVTEQHRRFRQSLGAGGTHVVAAYLLEKNRAIPARAGSDAADDADHDRENQEFPGCPCRRCSPRSAPDARPCSPDTARR